MTPAQAVEMFDGFLAQLNKSAKEEKPQWALIAYETDEDGDTVDENVLFVYEDLECARHEARLRSERDDNASVFYDVVEFDAEDEDGGEGDEAEDEDGDEADARPN